MKWSFVLSSLVVSVLSVNAFALDAQTAQIISHKEWTTGNIKGSFKDAVLDPKNIKSVILNQLNIKNKKQLSENVDGNNFVDVGLSGSYQRLQTPDNEYSVFAYPEIQMLNDTNEERLYKINSKLCIYDFDGSPTELGCYHSENVAKLSPRQYADFIAGLQADFQYDKNHFHLAYIGLLNVEVNVDNNASVFNSHMHIFIFPDDESSTPDALSANVYLNNLQTNK